MPRRPEIKEAPKQGESANGKPSHTNEIIDINGLKIVIKIPNKDQ